MENNPYLSINDFVSNMFKVFSKLFYFNVRASSLMEDKVEQARPEFKSQLCDSGQVSERALASVSSLLKWD